MECGSLLPLSFAGSLLPAPPRASSRHKAAASCRTPKPTCAKQPLLGGWRRDRGLMSAAHRGRGAIKREDGTATTFLRAQASPLPHHPYLSLPPFPPPPRFLCRLVAVVKLAVRPPARSLPPRNVSEALNLITQTSQKRSLRHPASLAGAKRVPCNDGLGGTCVYLASDRIFYRLVLHVVRTLWRSGQRPHVHTPEMLRTARRHTTT